MTRLEVPGDVDGKPQRKWEVTASSGQGSADLRPQTLESKGQAACLVHQSPRLLPGTLAPLSSFCPPDCLQTSHVQGNEAAWSRSVAS